MDPLQDLMLTWCAGVDPVIVLCFVKLMQGYWLAIDWVSLPYRPLTRGKCVTFSGAWGNYLPNGLPRSYIQPLSNWPSIGDRTRRSVLRPFQQLSDWHPILLQWVPSHVGLPRNEVADDLANVAASNPVDLEDHMVLTSTEIYSRAKDLICRTWVVPPVQPLYFQSHPGSAISFKGCRSYQTAFLLFSTGRLRCMKFEGGKKKLLNLHQMRGHQSFFSSAHSAMSGVFP
ncbi:RNase H domain-containing protein [Trichonephila clavipes]|nr:RNase H domain-containing protein [Trichonephila clavipes]